MNKTQFNEKLAEMLELEKGAITGDEALADLAKWDSLAVLSFIAMADSELSIEVSAADLQKCRLVSDLFRLISPSSGT